VRILLDESLPRPLARMLPEHDIRTVAAMGWVGKRNSELLRLAATAFDAVLTADQNLEHQQNLDARPIAVVVLVAPTNRIESLRLLIPDLLSALQSLAPRQLVHVRG
jgi:predicted nuclease of predicted toxin-antitoxin system